MESPTKSVVDLVLRYGLLRDGRLKRQLSKEFPERDSSGAPARYTESMHTIFVVVAAEYLRGRLLVTSDISHLSNIPKSSARRAIAALEEAGIVSLHKDSNDGRRQIVRLAKKSQRLVTSFVEECAVEFEEIINQFDRRERETAELKYQKLFENAEISIWNENFSEIFREFERLRQSGISDLRRYLGENKSAALEMASHVKIINVNSATLRMFGAQSEEELLGSLDSLVGQETIELFTDELCAIWEKEKTFRRETSIRTLKGDCLTVIISMPIPAEEADYASVPVTILDVTDLKQNEEALKQSEARLDSFFANAPVGLSIYDDQNRYLKVNRTLAGWNKTSADEHIGKTINEVFPEFEKLAGATAPDIIQTGDKVANFELTAAPVSSPEEEMDWNISRFRIPASDGSPQTTGSVIMNVTDLKRAEKAVEESHQRLSKILAIAPDAIVVIGNDFNIQVFNRGAEKVFGYQSDEVVGQSLDVLLPERFRKQHAGQIKHFLKAENDAKLMSERSEVFGLRKNGEEFPAEASITKLKLGNEIILTVMLHDISKRKRAEAQVVAAMEMAEHADRAKSEFLANMSHELRTPLNAIIGFAEIMSSQTLGPVGNSQYESYINDIHQSGKHLLSLIGDILDLSKIESGQMQLALTPVDLNQAINWSVRMINETAHRKAISLDIDLDEGLPEVSGDSRAPRQVIVNILTNAVKFTHDQGRVTVRTSSGPEGSIVAQITDTGIGISAEDIPTVLKPFGQISSGELGAQEGTGLGLSLSKRLIELHGATFTLESEPGVGTTIALAFPALTID